MSELSVYEKFQLQGADVKKKFESVYLENLFKVNKAKGIKESDIIHYLHKAQISGADPIMDEIYLIQRNVKVSKKNEIDRYETVGTTVFNYNFVNKVAQESGKLNGISDEQGVGEYYDPIDNKNIPMFFVKVTVKRGQDTFTFTAWFEEYVQRTYEGKVTATWGSKPRFMLWKCAVAGALRLAFPESLAGKFIMEEMGSIEKADEYIEAEFREQAEVEKKLAQDAEFERKKNSTDNAEKIGATIQDIKLLMHDVTKDFNVAEKGAAMVKILKINSYEELKSETLHEITLRLVDLKQALSDTERIKEYRNNVIASRKPDPKKKPSFIPGETVNLFGEENI